MNKAKPSVKLSYDKTKTGDLSVKLRVYWAGQKTRFHLPIKEGIIVSPAEYEKLLQYHKDRNKRRSQEETRRVYDRIAPFLEKAEAICEAMDTFTPAAFETLFYSAAQAIDGTHTVLAVLARLQADNDKQERTGNADAYKNPATSLRRFLGQLTPAEREQWLGSARAEAEQFTFAQMTTAFLEAYEEWMLKAGKASKKAGGASTGASLTTVGIYSRAFRTAFNEAIRVGAATEKQYPFGKNGFVPPAGRNPKKALKKDVIDLIRAYVPENGDYEERSRDLWVLSFLSNGLNFADLCALRWSAISYRDETITVIRKKTGRTQRGNQIKIVAQLFDESRRIIERWKSPRTRPTDYVFPFLNDAMTARQKRDTSRQVIKVTNQWMAKIGKKLGIEADIKTYAARHSFATILLKAGVAPNEIKNRLAHSSLKITETYFGDFEDEDVKKLVKDSLL